MRSSLTISLLLAILVATVVGKGDTAGYDWETDPDGKYDEEIKPTGGENRNLNNFPPIVDVTMSTDCAELPEDFPSDFIFEKVMEQFHEEVTGYEDILPDEPLPEGFVLDGDALHMELSDHEFHEGDLYGSLENARRGLVINTCPKCKNAERFLRCLKNRCSGSRGRRLQSPPDRKLRGSRRLTGAQTEQRELKEVTLEDIKATLDFADSVKEAAFNSQFKAEECHRELLQMEASRDESMENYKKLKGDERDALDVLVKDIESKREVCVERATRTKVLQDTAALLAQKAELQSMRTYLEHKQKEFITETAEEWQGDKLQKEEQRVMQLKQEIVESKSLIKEMKEVSKKKEKLLKVKLDHEKTWIQAIHVLEITEDELKDIGKVERVLNRIVRRFADMYKVECPIGIEVVMLASGKTD